VNTSRVLRLVAGSVLLPVALGGCESKLDLEPSEIVGEYVLDHGTATDIIVIRREGTYTHYYKRLGGAARTDSGTWRIASVEGPRIVFSGFRSWSDTEMSAQQASGAVPEPEEWSPVFRHRTTGASVLVLDPDLNWNYVRKEPMPRASAEKGPARRDSVP